MAQLERTAAAEFLSNDDLALVTATEASPRINVPASTIRRWKQKEWLTVQGWNAQGDPLYSLREVIEVEYATRNGAGRRRDA